jgi:hypothetical protein
MRKLLQTTAELAIRYLEGLDARNVAPTQEAIANLIQFDEPLPNQPVDADLIERTCRHARHFAKELTAAGYPILNDVVLNQVIVSFGDAETTHRVIADIQAEGTCWCGSTVWQGQTAMRISVSSWATTDADVEKSLAAMLRVAGKYCSGEF